MPKYEVRLTDGYCYTDVLVEADNIEQACEAAMKREDALCDEPFESDGDLEGVDSISELDVSGDLDVPEKYQRRSWLERELLAEVRALKETIHRLTTTAPQE